MGLKMILDSCSVQKSRKTSTSKHPPTTTTYRPIVAWLDGGCSGCVILDERTWNTTNCSLAALVAIYIFN